MFQRIRRRQAGRAQHIVSIVAWLHVAVRVREVGTWREEVPAFLRDQVDRDAGGIALGRDASGGHRRFHHGLRIHDVACRADARQVIHIHPIVGVFWTALPMELGRGRLVRLVDPAHTAAAHIGAGRHSRDQVGEADDALRATRQCRQHIGRHHALHLHVLRVHERGPACHRQRLGDPAHIQVGVDGGRETTSQRDPFSPEGAEARQREGHRISAGQDTDDVIAAQTISDDGANLLDQHRTGRFDRDAGKNGARRVSHHASNAARLLRPHDRYYQHNAERNDSADEHDSESFHTSLLAVYRT